jgi:hypothetical protein
MHAILRLENLKGRNHLEYLGVVGKVILEWILEEQIKKMCTGFIWLMIAVAGFCENDNERSVP